MATGAFLLVLFALAGFNSLVRDSATFDETAHLPAGLSYLERGDFRLNPEHPPLSKAWAALPLWLFAESRSDYDDSAWTGRPVVPGDPRLSGADQWRFGHGVLNGRPRVTGRRDPMEMLIPARTSMLVLGLLLGLIVWAWATELWGPHGGLLALFLFALSPTMLAHGRLVTTDLPSALGFALVLWTFWRLCDAPGPGRAATFAVSVVPALLIKFSSLLLGPILLLLAGVTWLGRERERRRELARWLAVGLLAALVAGILGLWAGYGFRFAAAADPDYRLDWEIVGLQEGPLAEAIHGAVDAELLPEAYLYGIAYFLGGAARRVAYLNGESSLIGWWYYFPEAFLLKTPPALLLLVPWAAIVAIRRRRVVPRAVFLAIPVAIYVGVSMAGNLNIGHRHLTPVYPLLFVLVGALARVLDSERRGRTLLFLLLAGFAASFAWATPGYLSYFNRLAGGPRGGPRYLLDSNVDWGQDLLRLKRWMDERGVPRIHLVYFGTADPAALGIEYSPVLMVHDFRPRRPKSLPPRGEWVAVSVNLLHGLYDDRERLLAEELLGRGLVEPERIRAWSAYRDRASGAGSPHDGLGTWLVGEGALSPETLQRVEAGSASDWLRRLRETEEPVAYVGDSIRIYRAP